MFTKLVLLSSLLLNGYLYIFHFNTSEVIVKSVKEKPSPVVINEKSPIETIKKSRLNASKKNLASVKNQKADQTAEQDEKNSFSMPVDLAFEDYIADQLKYELNLDQDKIETYSKLKKHYKEETNSVYKIPNTHDPDETYIPTYKENKQYYDLVTEYHHKLKELMGPSRYTRYEKLRTENNKRVIRDWQENEGRSDLQYMQF